MPKHTSAATLKTLTDNTLEPFRLGPHTTDIYKGRPPKYAPVLDEEGKRIIAWNKVSPGIPYVNLSKRAHRISKENANA